jgi:acetylornithine deacetylase/succinyl-diaminopimelate desuccinylase-like protein
MCVRGFFINLCVFFMSSITTSSPLSPTHVATRIQELIDRDFAAQCAFLAELVKVPTDNPPGDCAAHAENARTLLEAMGFGVEVDAVPTADTHAVGMISATNLIVRRRFSDHGPCIALNAHGDVVPPGLGWSKDPYGAEVVNDPTSGPTMYGRGVAVSKSDFATYTYALRVLDQLVAEGCPLIGSVELHFTYDEEVGGDIGPLRLLQQGLSRPDYAISAGFSYAVTTAHNGCLHLEVTVRGQQAHAAMPDTGVDALVATTGILQSIYASRAALKSVHSATHGITHPTLNVGLIAGGINTNVVPDRITFRIDRRIIPEESPSQVEIELRALIEQEAAAYAGITIEIRRVLLALPLLRLAGAERLINALQRNGEHFFGVPIAEQGVPLYTDARHYVAAGIPTVLYGAGPRTLGEAHGHAADERLCLEDLRRATATIAATLVELLCDGATSHG